MFCNGCWSLMVIVPCLVLVFISCVVCGYCNGFTLLVRWCVCFVSVALLCYCVL